MKSISPTHRFSFGIIAGLFLFFCTATPSQAKAGTAGLGISFEVFYQNLAPHGNWINDVEFGFIWSPHVGNDFRPYYSNGYWANTEYGNMWVSNYDWGWAPFHYGRWTLHNRYGWVWVPGYEWGPAWVSWRAGSGYYGWAPLRPGVSINISFGSGYHVPSSYWTFVPYRNLYAANVYRYHVPRRAPSLVSNTTIINNTYVDNSVTYVSGPSRSDVRRRTGSRVKTYQVNNTNVRSAAHSRSRVSGNKIAIYRPESTRRSASNMRSSNTNTRSHNTRAASTTTTARRSATAETARSMRNTSGKTGSSTRKAATSTRSSAAPRRTVNAAKPATTSRATRTSAGKTAPAVRSSSRSTTTRTSVSSRRSTPKATTATRARKTPTTPKRTTNTRSSVRSTRSSSVRSTPRKSNVSRSTSTRSKSTATRRR